VEYAMYPGGATRFGGGGGGIAEPTGGGRGGGGGGIGDGGGGGASLTPVTVVAHGCARTTNPDTAGRGDRRCGAARQVRKDIGGAVETDAWLISSVPTTKVGA